MFLISDVKKKESRLIMLSESLVSYHVFFRLQR
jgi:hypothetical protein